jgi:hypothetical protein
MNSNRSSRLSRDVQPGSSQVSKHSSKRSSLPSQASNRSSMRDALSDAQRQTILDRITTAGNRADPTVSPAKPVSTESPRKNLNLDAKESRTLGRSPSRARLDGSVAGSVSNFELLGDNNSVLADDGAQLWSRPASRRESGTSNVTNIQTSGDYQRASNYCERQKLNAWRRFSANINEYCERREHSARRVTATKKDDLKTRLTTASHRDSFTGMPARHSQAISYNPDSKTGNLHDSESSDRGVGC